MLSRVFDYSDPDTLTRQHLLGVLSANLQGVNVLSEIARVAFDMNPVANR